jgi:predicted phage terminase large subunit-like protein
LALDAGVNVGGIMRSWTKPDLSEVKWSSIGGQLTGQPIDGIAIVDDPIKDAEQARSKLQRENAEEWMRKVLMTRLHPGASVILMATRWHEDDLSGRFIKKDGWEYVNLQAIAEGQADANEFVIGDPLGRRLGEPLWPEHRPVSFLSEFRKNAHTWAALYQGAPRPAGAEVFKVHPARYERLPDGPFRQGHGVDLAYTSKTSADFSVCVSGRKYGRKLYVTRVVRKQMAATDFTQHLKMAMGQARGPMLWHASGSEKGTAQFITQKIPGFEMRPASTDKFTRAQPASEAWNQDDILLPEKGSEYYGPWVDDLIDEVASFTGINDPHDDQVDALGSLWEALRGNGAPPANLDQRIPGFDY